MRAAIWAALALGLATAAGTARAADLTDPVWAQAPGQSDWARAYPAAAASAGVSGDVRLRCTATAAGALDGCQVISETPAAAGFGAAALSLTPHMQLKPGDGIAGRSLVVPVRFDPALLRPGPHVISNPDWLHRPSGDDMAKYYPATAGRTPGHATIECVVTNRGLLDGCDVVGESPQGLGFGAATLALSANFEMRPMTIDGQPVGGGKVIIPVGFRYSGDSEPPPTPDAMASNSGSSWVPGGVPDSGTISVLRAAPWSATPTAAELSAAFPHGALGRFPSAHVVLRCGLKRDGGLDDCSTVSQDPEHAGFDAAARSLVRDFRAMVGPHDRIANLYVDVPFDFSDPSAPPTPLEIYDPIWLQRIDSEAALRLYPAAATQAGVTQGESMVACEVAHDGSLTGCTVASETPAGLGFGAAALQIVAVMKMNPWTSQGTPVDGAHIQIPIRLMLPSADTPAATPAPSGSPPDAAPPGAQTPSSSDAPPATPK